VKKILREILEELQAIREALAEWDYGEDETTIGFVTEGGGEWEDDEEEEYEEWEEPITCHSAGGNLPLGVSFTVSWQPAHGFSVTSPKMQQ